MSRHLPPTEFHLPIVSSTNDYARELLPTYPYVFVSAQHQTAGRGRKGRVWEGGYGQNVYCSLGMQHSTMLQVEELSAFMARGALAILHSLRKLAPRILFRLKYPNDIQANVEGEWRKIAGVLVEHEFQADRCITTVIGMGINVSQQTFPDTITAACTSLQLLGIGVEVSVVLDHLREQIADLRSKDWQQVHAEWILELDIVGKEVELAGEEGAWMIVRVLSDGRLVARKQQFSTERIISDGDTVRYHD